MRRLVLTLIAVVAVALAGASPTLATPPPSHKVAICHATPPDTAAQGWVAIEVDIASTGYMQAGHQDEHDADIIPAYSYDDGFSYAGKNLTTLFDGVYGSYILANGCQIASETAGPSVLPSADPSIPPCDECGGPGDEPSPPNTATDDVTATTASNVSLSLIIGLLVGSLFILLLTPKRR